MQISRTATPYHNTSAYLTERDDILHCRVPLRVTAGLKDGRVFSVLVRENLKTFRAPTLGPKSACSLAGQNFGYHYFRLLQLVPYV